MTMPTPITRRTLFKGLGGVTIGLPFLEEMALPRAHAASSAAVPARAFNLFFGLGIPTPLQQEGYAGVMEPLKPLSDKLMILRGIDHVRCDQPGINAHYDGSTAAFTAEPPNGTARAGGPSLDQAIRAGLHPNGLPPDVIPTLVSGTFFRRDRPSRFAKSFGVDGSLAATVQETPRELFDRVFGKSPEDASSPRAKRLRRSVLDATLEQFNFFSGANSPLGSSSKARLSDHFDRIREIEQRINRHEEKRRIAFEPTRPPESKLPHGGAADPGGEGIDITLEDLTEEWHLMAGIYALAIQCDRVRFGSLTFLAAGERIRLKGDYVYNGQKRFEFNDALHRGTGGAQGCSHEWWHAFGEKKDNKELRAHAHMKMREVAWFLRQLDGAESIESNGRTILENALITISTESGDGRHNDSKRELSGVFHAVTGANGRFKTGGILDVNAEGLDVYNTLIAGMGSSQRLGPSDREFRAVDSLRA